MKYLKRFFNAIIYTCGVLSLLVIFMHVVLDFLGFTGPQDFCADAGGVWDSEFGECRFDCLKWQKETGCIMLTDEELEEYVNAYCQKDGKGLYRCRQSALELSKRKQWQKMKMQ